MGTTGPLLQVVGTCTLVQVPLTVATTAYAANNNVGGLLNIPSAAAFRILGAPAKLVSLAITDRSHNAALLDLVLFTAKPSASFTDHAAFPTLAQADLSLVIGRISTAATDWATVGGAGICTKTVQNLVVDELVNGTGLYLAINAQGTPTFAAATDVTLWFGFQND